MKNIWIATRLFFWMTLLTGFLYPLTMTGIGKIFFRSEVEGSQIVRNGQVVGSKLIAQPFTNPTYFWPRPSAVDYNSLSSAGSNLGVTHPDFQKKAQDRRALLNVSDPPLDLLYASGSGLDPHISPRAADVQISRIALARKVSPDDLNRLVQSMVEPPTFGILGEPRVNVLLLNLKLDERFPIGK